MPNTIDQVIQYARDHPKRDGKSWAGWCESFVWRAGGFNGSFETALAAGSSSGPLNPDWTDAPRGAIHHWAGVWMMVDGVWTECGHTCFELGGGTLLMASSRTSNYGTALGTIHFSDYGLPEYRGWSMRHGTETLAPSAALAGNGATPLEDDMTPIEMLNAGFKTGLKNPDGTERWATLAEALAAIYFYGEHDSKQNAETLAAANESIRIGNVNWQIISGIKAKPSTVIDPAKLAAELKAAGLAVTIDSAAFVKALDASLSPKFAAIPGAVRNAIVK